MPVRDPFSEWLRSRDLHVPLSPVILIDTVLIDMEPVRSVRETGLAAQARHCRLSFLARGVHADEFDVLNAVFPRMHMLQHVNAGHFLPPAPHSKARSPHFLILLNSLPGPVG